MSFKCLTNIKVVRYQKMQRSKLDQIQIQMFSKEV